MKRVRLTVLFCAVLLSMQASALFAQSLTLLHGFGATKDGQSPAGGVTLFGSTLYGTTLLGDTGSGYDAGTIYSIATNGSAYSVLYSFSGPDGQNPSSVPVVSGGFIYGTTDGGGSNNFGVIYRLALTGSNNFNVLHTFDGGAGGSSPQGDLLLSGGTLYGTAAGGLTNTGAVYSIGINGDSFTPLHSFSGGADGGQPGPGQLVLSGGTLYGTTVENGANNYGVIYSVSTNGSNFTVLHTFDKTNGGTPMGNLVLSGSTLYGTVEVGGTNGEGAVFAIGTDGSNYRQLYAFGAIGGGLIPTCTLAISSNTLYGTTSEGGSGGVGTVFAINTDGSGYNVLYNFSTLGETNTPAIATIPTNADGATPYGTLLISGTNIFGVAQQGGPNGYGTVFELPIPPASTPPPQFMPFFTHAVLLPPYTNGWYYMGHEGVDTDAFGYFNMTYYPYVLHLDMSWEYVLDAGNAAHGAYFYDFTDSAWFYTEPALFPYIYDFNLNHWLYYFPKSGSTDRYTSGPRDFDILPGTNVVQHL
ncbi:MAG TPA: choice-of-anchor tandem repeat GloVer-containing protein [Verrucomicrobiae bacterium]|nr:choice-of-anchor tandem repeat GloVer-containing protein [Verrucomicrobiae bacterium]